MLESIIEVYEKIKTDLVAALANSGIHIYRDHYSDTATNNDLFVLYRLSGADELETADGGGYKIRTAEIDVYFFARRSFLEVSDNWHSVVTKAEWVRTYLNTHGWIAEPLFNAGDVDQMGYDAYIFSASIPYED